MNELLRNERPIEVMDERPCTTPSTPNAVELRDGGEDTVCESPQPITNSQCESIYQFRNFSVEKLNHGYIVKVGCHRFAIESGERLGELLKEYITNPSEVEKRWWTSGVI